MESSDDFSRAVGDLLAQLPQPPWWRPIKRWRFPGRKKWVETCAYFRWPNWYSDAVALGADPDHLRYIWLMTHNDYESDQIFWPHPFPENPWR